MSIDSSRVEFELPMLEVGVRVPVNAFTFLDLIVHFGPPLGVVNEVFRVMERKTRDLLEYGQRDSGTSQESWRS